MKRKHQDEFPLGSCGANIPVNRREELNHT